jgi:ATP-dependent DNA helicase RecG
LLTDDAKALRELRLIEGRSPKYFISARVADVTGQKARYIHNRGLDDGYYQRLVLDYLASYGTATRADLDALVLPKLPDVLSAEQKSHKLKNLLQAMRRIGLVHTKGPRAYAQWLPGSGSAD